MTKKPTDDTNDKGPRIMAQFRTAAGMAYDFRCGARCLMLRVSARTSAADGGDWKFEASSGKGEEPANASAWGRTRAEALASLGEAWREHGFSTFDWGAVASALTAVRAI